MKAYVTRPRRFSCVLAAVLMLLFTLPGYGQHNGGTVKPPSGKVTKNQKQAGKTTTKQKTQTKKKTHVEPAPTEKYVDLGLSVKWATCNLGASKPESYGNFYAWGETTPQRSHEYSYESYKYADGDRNKITKYNIHSEYGNNGFTDGKRTLDDSDDAAVAKLGSPWRMPTMAEMNELAQKCRWKKTRRNGVRGMLVTGPSGKSIFLPMAGDYIEGERRFAGRDGFYWSRSLDLYPDKSTVGYCLYIHDGGLSPCGLARIRGFSIRPVRP